MDARAAAPKFERVGGLHATDQHIAGWSRPPYGPQHIQHRGRHADYFTSRCQIAVVAAAWFML
ncbi:hypothetical protein [Massilia alkalitolerans]|uniref:hypothetical protein n=1 Tax=Massilia alkalitolerans TaxID=286638 RepID=UPI0028AC52A5|nr:hypothetical protein [Massilia alkalitolerans]